MNEQKNQAKANKLLSMLKVSRKEIKNGNVSPVFSKASDVIRWLHDDNRKYQNETQ